MNLISIHFCLVVKDIFVENVETMSFPKFGRIVEMRPEYIMLMRVKPRDHSQRIWLELGRGRLTASVQEVKIPVYLTVYFIGVFKSQCTRDSDGENCRPPGFSCNLIVQTSNPDPFLYWPHLTRATAPQIWPPGATFKTLQVPTFIVLIFMGVPA
jgi:hypothetical protein